MNVFDGAVIAVVVVLAILGFRAGLLRSLADILGFIVAAPIAVSVTPFFASAAANSSSNPMFAENSLVFFGLFLAGGVIFAQLMRLAVVDFAGDDIHLVDRMAGLFLGAIRALLVTATIVLIFDRIIPSGRDPEYLKGSRIRPILSQASERGLRSLPPEITEYIDRLKKERGL